MTDPANIDAAAAAAVPQDAPDMRRRKSKAQEQQEEMQLRPILPEHCPVTPLGIEKQKIWVLDASNQIINMPTDCKKGELILLFGGCEFLDENWPQWKQPAKGSSDPIKDGFNQKEVQVDLLSACFGKGIFSPQGRVFGRGAHRAKDNDDQLVLHMGRSVLLSDVSNIDWRDGAPMGKASPKITLLKAGAIGDAYYPAAAALPAPAKVSSTPAEAEMLRKLFNEWSFAEQNAATLLLLGMCAQMHIGGALNWRAHMMLTGPTASGKSFLQRLLRSIHGDWVLGITDPTEAAIRQILDNDTLAVAIDEAEGDDNPDRQRAIINLVKKASSGDKIIRGGADHKAQEFTAQSCFLLSMVLHAPLKGEDRNRIAILDMIQIPETKAPLDINWTFWREMGRKMHRRMVEQWPRFADTLTTYKREIFKHGYTGRWQDTFGTLLACADMMLFDEAPRNRTSDGDKLTEQSWVRLILPLMAVARADARSDTDTLLPYLMSKTIPGSNGRAPESIGEWVQRAMTSKVDEIGNSSIDKEARNRLKSVGLRLVTLEQDPKKATGQMKYSGQPIPGDWRHAYLAVAYPTSAPLCELFKGTQWREGGWLQSLGKMPGCERGLKIRFAGDNPDNAYAIPASALRGADYDEEKE